MKKMSKVLILVLCLCMVSVNAFAMHTNMDAWLPVTEEPAELSFWTTRMQSVKDFDTQTMTGIMEELTNVHINWTQVDLNEKDTKLNLSLASGEYPDVYMTGFSTDQIMLYADDVFIPMDEYITPEITPNLYGILEEHPDVKDMITAPDGHIYTLFRTDCGVHMLSCNKMFVNKDWLDAYVEAGGKVPETTDEFEDMLAYFRDNDMNGNGDASDEMPLVSSASAWAGDPINYLLTPFAKTGNANGNNWFYAEDGELHFSANTDEFREGLKWISHLYDEKLLMEETYVMDGTQMQALINNADKTKLVVGAFSAAWQGVYTDANIVSHYDYVPLAPLAGPDGQRLAWSMSESGIAEFVLQCAITTACENPELAMRYLDLGFAPYEAGVDFYLQDGQAGVSYNWDDELPSMFGNSPTRTSITLEAVQGENWNNHTMPMWDTNERRYGVYADATSSAQALYDGHVAYEPYYVWCGVPLVTWCSDADLATETAELGTALGDYIKKSYTQFITGVEDIDDDAAWEKYCAELDGIGLEDYLAAKTEMIFG